VAVESHAVGHSIHSDDLLSAAELR
jgi:hypothetical protein